MRRVSQLIMVLLFIVALGSSPGATSIDWWHSTRVTDPQQYAQADSSGYPFRAKCEYILKELDLKPGDIVVDIGAGDGWWSERMAKFVGDKGIIHAAEIENKKVHKMKKKFAGLPQIEPYFANPTALIWRKTPVTWLSSPWSIII